MEPKIITGAQIRDFALALKNDERSEATIKKYLHDVYCFQAFAQDAPLDKPLVLRYKEQLGRNYAVASANSMLAALNSFFRFAGWEALCVKRFRFQRSVYQAEEKELSRAEYLRLVAAAQRGGNDRLYMLLQTICGTGIRVSELPYITVEALHRGEAVVRCKGNNRRIFIVSALRKKLLNYARKRKIKSGSVFITESGRPINRCSVWREMKRLCSAANVAPSKVFPHNLRHLFAKTFYTMEKDIAKLADILGHASINTTRIYIATSGIEHRQKLEHMRLII